MKARAELGRLEKPSEKNIKILTMKVIIDNINNILRSFENEGKK